MAMFKGELLQAVDVVAQGIEVQIHELIKKAVLEKVMPEIDKICEEAARGMVRQIETYETLHDRKIHLHVEFNKKND